MTISFMHWFIWSERYRNNYDTRIIFRTMDQSIKSNNEFCYVERDAPNNYGRIV